MQQTNSTPLWRELNEKRTQGDVAFKFAKWHPDAPTVGAVLKCNDIAILGIGVNMKTAVFEPEYISKITLTDVHGKKVPPPNVISSIEAEANAQYTALSVNNLHKLAEALTRIREASLQGLEMYANGEKFSFETLAGYVAEISGEALSAIS